MKKKKKGNSAVLKIVTYFILICAVLITVLPLGWVISTSIKPSGEIFAKPPQMDSGGSDYCKLYPCIDRELHTQGFFKQSVGWPDDIPHSTSSGRKCRICVRQI